MMSFRKRRCIQVSSKKVERISINHVALNLQLNQAPIKKTLITLQQKIILSFQG